MNEPGIGEILSILRALDEYEYLASIFVASALARRLGEIPDPWNRDEVTELLLADGGVICVEDGVLEGLPEVHVWYRRPRTLDLTEICAHLSSEQTYLSVSDLHVPILGLPDANTHLRERMLCRPPSQQNVGQPGLVTLSEHGPSAMCATGALSLDLAEIMLDSGAEPVVLTGGDGLWRSRCRLEPLDESVIEVCGVETNPRFRKHGWATRMLAAISSEDTTQVYLARDDNRPSQRTAEGAGFETVSCFDKYFLDISGDQRD